MYFPDCLLDACITSARRGEKGRAKEVRLSGWVEGGEKTVFWKEIQPAH